MIRGGFGKFNRCVELHSPTGVTTTQDGYGAPAETYSKYMSTYMRISPMSGSEFMMGQQIQARITGKATMRYDSRVAPKDRIIYKDGTTTRTLEINAVINIEERNEYLELWYVEIDT